METQPVPPRYRQGLDHVGARRMLNALQSTARGVVGGPARERRSDTRGWAAAAYREKVGLWTAAW
jgi:hypothetical protein